MNSLVTNLAISPAQREKTSASNVELVRLNRLLSAVQADKQSANTCYRRAMRAMTTAFKGKILVSQVLERGKKAESFNLVAWTHDEVYGVVFLEFFVNRQDPFSGRLTAILRMTPQALATLFQVYNVGSFAEFVEQRQALAAALAWEVVFINREITRPDEEFSFITRQAELCANKYADCEVVTVDSTIPFDTLPATFVRLRKSQLQYDWLVSTVGRQPPQRSSLRIISS